MASTVKFQLYIVNNTYTIKPLAKPLNRLPFMQAKHRH